LKILRKYICLLPREKKESQVGVKVVVEMKKELDLIKQFCYIQLQVLKDREMRLRKEIQETTLQMEFITSTIEKIGTTTDKEEN
jgi:hypothetical protein